jgi:hypothetical protein
LDKRLSVVFALVIAGAFPALSLNALQNQTNKYTEQEAVEIALDFVETCSTFLFDGVDDSGEVVSLDILRMPWTWEVTIRFQSTHAGYGNRSSQMLAQVMTAHEVRVTVSAGAVIRAVMDGEWDVLNQRETFQSEMIPPEVAKDLAVEYILENYHPDATLPEAWAFEVLTPDGIMDAFLQQFVGGGWEVNVSYPYLMSQAYGVSVSYTGNVDFTWRGKVDEYCNVEETSTSLTTRVLSPGEALNITLAFLSDLDAFEGVVIPSEWTIENLNPEGIVGYNRQQFKAEGWTVNVSNPVVWKPTYQVEVEYDGEFDFSWAGTINQDGTIVKPD